MKTQLKSLLIVLILAALLSGCGGAMPSKTSAQDANKVAASIADFQLPEDYKAEYSLSLAGFTIVAYNPGDDHSHLFFVQAPADYKEDQARLEEALRQAQTGKKDRDTRMTVVEKRQVSIRGQETTLVISEGVNSSDQQYREATATFQGKNGPALVVISEPVSRWDDARINQFIASIQ